MAGICKLFVSCLHSSPSIPVLKLKTPIPTWPDTTGHYTVLQISKKYQTKTKQQQQKESLQSVTFFKYI